MSLRSQEQCSSSLFSCCEPRSLDHFIWQWLLFAGEGQGWDAEIVLSQLLKLQVKSVSLPKAYSLFIYHAYT